MRRRFSSSDGWSAPPYEAVKAILPVAYVAVWLSTPAQGPDAELGVRVVSMYGCLAPFATQVEATNSTPASVPTAAHSFVYLRDEQKVKSGLIRVSRDSQAVELGRPVCSTAAKCVCMHE
jgi:hypothetical protein